MTRLLPLLALLVLVPARADGPPDGAALFAARCQGCHDLGVLAPTREQLGRLTVEEIEAALWHGTMQEHANGLTRPERLAIARLLGRPDDQPTDRSAGVTACTDGAPASAPASSAWPGWSRDNRFTRHLDDPALTAVRFAGLELAWAHPFPEHSAFSGAGNAVAVRDGTVYTGNLNHWVYALDAARGCAHWAFHAEGRVRSNVALEGDTLVFGDLLANVYGLDARTGRLRWRTRVDWTPGARITGNVTLDAGQVFVPVSSLEEVQAMRMDLPCCTFRGAVVALDAATGEVRWKTHTIEQYAEYLGENDMGVARFGPSGVPVWSGIAVDRKRGVVYVGNGNQFTEPRVDESDAVMALDIATGAKRWVMSLAPVQMGGADIYHLACEAWWDEERKNCSPENPEGHGDRDLGAPPLLVERADGREIVVAGSKDGMLYALDPDAAGQVLWSVRVGRGGEAGGIEFGIAADGRYAYAPVTDIDIDLASRGSLTAVDLVTGEPAWRVDDIAPRCAGKPTPPCGNGVATPPTVAGEVVLVGLLDGTLRGYRRDDGSAVFVLDTAQDFAGVNGRSGHGGALGNGGPVVAGDYVYLNSGFNILNVGLPGNVLLAYRLPAAAR
ncbi:MAG: PQQ-binding-like beta-propeller repeat protein [Gammaproteobacteria bacterium]|nr:PQQ-binding-like beta-propeller repeat protein [Gammaproteobacteria bacterium]